MPNIVLNLNDYHRWGPPEHLFEVKTLNLNNKVSFFFQMSKITSFQMMCWPLMCSLSGSKIKWEQKRSVPESPVTRGRKFVLCSYKVKKKCEKCVTWTQSV